MQNNPHYGITVTQRCKLFVSLIQKEKIDRNTGKFPIFFMIQRNDGKRIRDNAKNKLVGKSGAPIAKVILTEEINLDADSFPYTFSLMIATMEEGGESDYTLQLYCTDKQVKVIDDK